MRAAGVAGGAGVWLWKKLVVVFGRRSACVAAGGAKLRVVVERGACGARVEARLLHLGLLLLVALGGRHARDQIHNVLRVQLVRIICAKYLCFGSILVRLIFVFLFDIFRVCFSSFLGNFRKFNLLVVTVFIIGYFKPNCRPRARSLASHEHDLPIDTRPLSTNSSTSWPNWLPTGGEP